MSNSMSIDGPQVTVVMCSHNRPADPNFALVVARTPNGVRASGYDHMTGHGGMRVEKFKFRV